MANASLGHWTLNLAITFQWPVGRWSNRVCRFRMLGKMRVSGTFVSHWALRFNDVPNAQRSCPVCCRHQSRCCSCDQKGWQVYSALRTEPRWSLHEDWVQAWPHLRAGCRSLWFLELWGRTLLITQLLPAAGRGWAPSSMAAFWLDSWVSLEYQVSQWQRELRDLRTNSVMTLNIQERGFLRMGYGWCLSWKKNGINTHWKN